MTFHKISSSDFESDYLLIAIHSNSQSYKLAFEINLKLKTKLKKSNYDISFKNDNSVFEIYKHESETYNTRLYFCLLYTSPSPRDATTSRMPSSA